MQEETTFPQKKLIFRCSSETSIREISGFLRGQNATVVLVAQGKIQGVIHDYHALVDDHSFPDSPLPIGPLLTNAARAYWLIAGLETLEKSAAFKNKKWLELLSSSKKLVAWLSIPTGAGQWARTQHSDPRLFQSRKQAA